MNQRWTLHVERLGKIRNARIELKPMMLFVGDNNSGKSYLMSLLWGILTLGGNLFPRKPERSEIYKKCEEWLEDRIEQEEIIIDDVAQKLFVAWFNELLGQGVELLVKRVFNYSVEVGKVYITDFITDIPLIVKWEDSGLYENLHEVDRQIFGIPRNIDLYRKLCNICYEIILTGVRSKHSFSDEKPLYLPASRTGFMLSYKRLLSDSLDTDSIYSFTGAKNRKSNQFPLTVTRFLQWLINLDIDKNQSAYAEIADFIEQQILKGEIRKDNSPVPNYLYRSNGSNQDMPLYVTSSLVSELSPIILFTKSKSENSVFIVEEPEAHLHLSMQKQLANALIRLMNRGMPVWLTTHSDTLFQQINNMIKLYNRNDIVLPVEYGYEKQDLLDPVKVSAYQFSVQNDNATTVEPLTLTKYGFIVPSFNEIIAAQTEEAYLFQESDSDAD